MNEAQQAELVRALDGFTQTVHALAMEKGWWEGPERNIPEQLCLQHSEISEALEEYRAGRPMNEIYRDDNGKPCGIPIELADLIIRVGDMCGRYHIDLANAILVKHEYNKTRPHRHGNKRC